MTDERRPDEPVDPTVATSLAEALTMIDDPDAGADAVDPTHPDNPFTPDDLASRSAARDAADLDDVLEAALDVAFDDTGEDSPVGGEEQTPDRPVTLGEPPAAVKEATVTSVVCPKCTTKAGWRGALVLEGSAFEKRGLCEATGLPNCPNCGSPMVSAGATDAREALAQAAAALDHERAGDAARPMFQLSMPGLLPPFDFRSALVQIESLERNVQEAETAWKKAKDIAADRKGEFDEAVAALRAHVQTVHNQRLNAEYQNGRAAAPAPVPAPVDESAPAAAAPTAGPCAFERRTGHPCSVCRNAHGVVPPESNTLRHLATSLVNETIAGSAAPQAAEDAFLAALDAIADVWIRVEEVRAWTPEDRRLVAAWLVAFAGDREENGEPWARPIPLPLGRFHEAAEMADNGRQSCRICGGVLREDLSDAADGFQIGRKVGTDCPGEPEAAAAPEPARTTARRHKTTRDAAAAKQKASKPRGSRKAAK